MRNSNIKNTKEKNLTWKSIILLNFIIITHLFFQDTCIQNTDTQRDSSFLWSLYIYKYIDLSFEFVKKKKFIMGFPRQEYWSGQLFPSAGDLSDLGIKPRSPALQTDSSPTEPLRSVSQSVSSVTQSCPTLCNPMNRSTPGLPVHHQLPEFTQTHVH